MSRPHRIDGPALIVREAEARLLWPALRAWVDERARVGASQQISAVAPLLAEWEQIALGVSARARPGRASTRDAVPSALMTTSEAALRLHRSPAQVRRWCDRGDLDATKSGRDWMISAASVEALENLNA